MTQDENLIPPSRLSRIETLWSVIKVAHQQAPDSAAPQKLAEAQQKLLELYGSAIKRYLLASVRNPDTADELFQDFAVRFVNGEFKSADPTKGKFRSFVKTVLARMIALHFRKLKSCKEKHVSDKMELESADESKPEDEVVFLASWREELLARTWTALAQYDAEHGTCHDTILRIRVSDPSLSSEQLAHKIELATGSQTSSGSARVKVHRAREKFAEILIDVVSDSLESRERHEIEGELIELGLIDYCKEALGKIHPQA